MISRGGNSKKSKKYLASKNYSYRLIFLMLQNEARSFTRGSNKFGASKPSSDVILWGCSCSDIVDRQDL